MTDAFIVAAARTAGGKRNGRLRNWHPADLAGRLLDELVNRAGIDPRAIDDVVMGCVSQVGDQANQIGRTAVFASGLPDSIPAVTIDRQCGSSQQAIHFAAQAVMSGVQDVVIASGVESMTRVPMGLSVQGAAASGASAEPWSRKSLERYGVTGFSQFAGAQMIAEKHGFVREDLDAYGLESHRKAVAAIQAGAFLGELMVVDGHDGDGNIVAHDRDEGIRYDATVQSMASVKPIVEGGMLTAATSSQICDGASGVLIVNERALKAHGLTPLARIDSMTVTAGDPVIMLEEPIPGTRRALERSGRSLAEIDIFEVNEAFAPVPLAWLKELDADPAKLNVNGGAIALGHPLGASGTKLMATLVYALKSQNARFGLQTMCEGGGMANVTIIEAL